MLFFVNLRFILWYFQMYLFVHTEATLVHFSPPHVHLWCPQCPPLSSDTFTPVNCTVEPALPSGGPQFPAWPQASCASPATPSLPSPSRRGSAQACSLALPIPDPGTEQQVPPGHSQAQGSFLPPPILAGWHWVWSH